MTYNTGLQEAFIGGTVRRCTPIPLPSSLLPTVEIGGGKASLALHGGSPEKESGKRGKRWKLLYRVTEVVLYVLLVQTQVDGRHTRRVRTALSAINGQGHGPRSLGLEHLALVIGLRRPRKILHRHRLVAIYQEHRFMTKYELLRCNFLEPQRFRETNLLSAKMLSARCLAKAADRNSDPGSDTAKFCRSTSNVKLRLNRYRMFLFAANMLFRGGDAALAAGAARWVR